MGQAMAGANDAKDGRMAGTGRKGRAAGRLVLALLGAVLPGCAIKEGSTDSSAGTGIVITVTDSSKVNLDFGNLGDSVFRDSGDINLDMLRKKIYDKELDPSSVRITGLVVSYDDSTRGFLEDNIDVPFVLRVYLRDLSSDTARARLTLESKLDPDQALRLDPQRALFKLNEDLFGHDDGMPFLLSALKDGAVDRIRVIAEVRLLRPLKQGGRLGLNLVVDVAGKL